MWKENETVEQVLQEACHPHACPLPWGCQDPGQVEVLIAAQQRLDKPW